MIDVEKIKTASEIFFNFTSPLVALLVGYWSWKRVEADPKPIPRKKPKHRK